MSGENTNPEENPIPGQDVQGTPAAETPAEEVTPAGENLEPGSEPVSPVVTEEPTPVPTEESPAPENPVEEFNIDNMPEGLPSEQVKQIEAEENPNVAPETNDALAPSAPTPEPIPAPEEAAAPTPGAEVEVNTPTDSADVPFIPEGEEASIPPEVVPEEEIVEQVVEEEVPAAEELTPAPDDFEPELKPFNEPRPENLRAPLSQNERDYYESIIRGQKNTIATLRAKYFEATLAKPDASPES